MTMSDAIHECETEATWRVKALLRTKRFYSDAEMIQLYKTNILSYVEYRTPAIAHASSTHLDKLDRVQKRFWLNYKYLKKKRFVLTTLLRCLRGEIWHFLV